MYLIPINLLQGTVIAGYSDTYEPDYIDEALLPLPSQLSPYVSNWAEAIELGVALLFNVNTSTLQTSPVALDSWCVSTDYELNPTLIIWTYSGEDNYIFLGSGGWTQNLFSSTWPTQEVPFLFTWPQVEARGLTLKIEMTPTLNDYVISGTPLPPVFTSLAEILTDPQAHYSTPNDAVVAMSNGLEGLASENDESWPPLDPFA